MADPSELARRAFDRGDWSTAFAELSAFEPVSLDDLERLAVCAHMVGDARVSELAWERAHRVAAMEGDHDRAARCAFWLGFDLLLRGESAHASGWFARAQRLTSEGDIGAAAGYLLLPPFLEKLGSGDAVTALSIAGRMDALGQQAGDSDLRAFGLLCQGEALIVLGQLDEGMRRLDEAMVSVTTGEVSPVPTGIIYCAVIDACMHARDIRRAAEWTDALSAWCATDPSIVPYRGQCLVHRSQVLMSKGDWKQAGTEAERARAHLAAHDHPALGYALYQQGELHRVRGELAEAEQAYRAASRHRRDPVPGFALLRLAQGRVDAAVTLARGMLDEHRSHPDRPALLAAAVEILVASHALDDADTACDELEARAATSEVVTAMAKHARALLMVSAGNPTGAGVLLRDALPIWQGLDMPYEEARTRALLARVLAARGDADASDMQRDAARVAFEALGARTDLSHLAPAEDPSPLTDREVEVLRLVAAGRTNRDIATALVISEHTVARHVQNIFTKVGVSSRAAATAYAYKRGLA